MDPLPDPDTAWAALIARDRAFDGRFVWSVASTGVYCKPSCPARRPRRDYVAFHADGEAARAAGFRACKRCRPDELARDEAAIAQALRLIAAAEERINLAELAAAVGYAPHHFQRLFTRALGVSPAAYARGLRAGAAAEALTREPSVTGAIYEAGYAAPSRFYASAAPRLGMAPRAYRAGGAGEVIRWTIAATSLGPLLIAATDKGLCRVAFDAGPEDLARRFPQAELIAGDADFAALAGQVVAAVEEPAAARALPLDARGTAFQEAVWRALATVPPGETLSYAELAARAGRPAAVRA
ncbi:MAG: helix-turn-helix domain-containing protein, partial [Sphingomonas sp.]|nr:helix-turn-helix domain-containing protein [Sphingomonas sp.]